MSFLIRIGIELQQEVNNIEVTFVGSDHEACIIVFVGYVYISIVFCKVFNNVKSTIKTCSAHWCGVGTSGVVDIGTGTDQHLHYTEMTSSWKSNII